MAFHKIKEFLNEEKNIKAMDIWFEDCIHIIAGPHTFILFKESSKESRIYIPIQNRIVFLNSKGIHGANYERGIKGLRMHWKKSISCNFIERRSLQLKNGKELRSDY